MRPSRIVPSAPRIRAALRVCGRRFDLSCSVHDLLAGSGPGGPITFFKKESNPKKQARDRCPGTDVVGRRVPDSRRVRAAGGDNSLRSDSADLKRPARTLRESAASQWAATARLRHRHYRVSLRVDGVHDSASSLAWRRSTRSLFVVPAHAGTQWRCSVYSRSTPLGSRVRGNDGASCVTPAKAGAQLLRWCTWVPACAGTTRE